MTTKFRPISNQKMGSILEIRAGLMILKNLEPGMSAHLMLKAD